MRGRQEPAVTTGYHGAIIILSGQSSTEDWRHSKKDRPVTKPHRYEAVVLLSRLRNNYFSTREPRRSARVAQWKNTLAGCSKRPSSKAAGESKPEAYPQGYVEDFDELRTKLADFFSILLRYLESASQSEVTRHRQGLG